VLRLRLIAAGDGLPAKQTHELADGFDRYRQNAKETEQRRNRGNAPRPENVVFERTARC
jgi:hypothetical protein